MKQNLFNLRAAINEDRALLNVINRQLKRMDGEEVFYSDREEDANYLHWKANIPRNADRYYLEGFKKETLKYLEQNRYEAAMIRLELPLTPCGFVIALIRAKRIQARQRKRNKRRRRKSVRK